MIIKSFILCGGSGTRLWPVSRKSYPKQFVELFNGKSLLKTTLERQLFVSDNINCIGSIGHEFLISNEMASLNIQGSILLESEQRNTAGSVALAALSASPDDVIMITPSDIYMPDVEYFRDVVNSSVDFCEDNIVIFGVRPTFPSTAYGYINFSHGKFCGFVEKPEYSTAKYMYESGCYLWNSGIYIGVARNFIAEFEKFQPSIIENCKKAIDHKASKCILMQDAIYPNPEFYSRVPISSFDSAISERSRSLCCVEYDSTWSDLGGWEVVSDFFESDEFGNRSNGLATFTKCNNTFIHTDQRAVLAVGVDDLIIVDSPDALLVASTGCDQYVKVGVEEMLNRGTVSASEHRKIYRPWGWYDTVDSGPGYKIKRISVTAGSSLSLQIHKHRSEHWVIVSGTALVTRGDETFTLSKNESAYIPSGIKHRLTNPSSELLEIVEIQTGSYLHEDDIIRIEDNYGREA